MMQLFMLVGLAVSCSAAPQMYRTVSGDIMFFRSDIPAVVKIPEPGIRLAAFVKVPVPTIVSVPQPTVLNAIPEEQETVVPVVRATEFVTPATSQIVSVVPTVKAVPQPKVIEISPVEESVVVNVEPVPALKAAEPVTAVDTVTVVQAAPQVPVIKSAPVVPAIPVVAPVAVTPIAPEVKSVVIGTPAVTVAEAPSPLDAPEPPMPSIGVPHVGGQFHAQDEAGQYSFVHYGGPNTRVETRDFLGRTSGSFAYVDPEGDVQVRKYAAAPASGFRVAASDLVEDTPEVAQVKSAFLRAHEAVKALTYDPVVVSTV